MTDIEINRQLKLLEIAIEDVGDSSKTGVNLEPLFPGSLTLRQARLSSPSTSDSERRKSKPDFALLPEPHAWYVAHRSVPDYYLTSVDSKHLPYILVSNDFISKNEIDKIQFLLQNIITFRCNVFLAPTSQSNPISLNDFHSKLKNISEQVNGVYLMNINNGADKLSLIKHAHHFLGYSLDEMTDAISLGVSSFWNINSIDIDTDQYLCLTLEKRLDVARSMLQQAVTDRLQNHELIETYQDLANALTVQQSKASLENQPVLSKPIMPLFLPSPSITQEQKRALALASFLRKCRKFRESPKRFIKDSKLLRLK